MPGVGECYRALCGAYLGLSKLTNFFALALAALYYIRFQLLTDAEPRPLGVSGESAHYVFMSWTKTQPFLLTRSSGLLNRASPLDP